MRPALGIALLLLMTGCGSAEVEGPCMPAPEACNGRDDDCNGVVDEGYDLDGDGAFVDDEGCRAQGLPIDCDDGDRSVRPGVTDACFDGVDNDCNGVVDDPADADGDGTPSCADCDDGDANVHPGAEEACDGVDNDCSGAADEPWDADGDGSAACAGDCDDDDPNRAPTLPERCNGIDDDCDGQTDEDSDRDGDGWRTCRGDCDDDDPLSYPGAPEICDGQDNDCDATTVDDVDTDGDGFTVCDGDCAPVQGGAHPGAVEVCDGLDNDCNGTTDELPSCYGCSQPDPTGEPDLWACGSWITWAQADAACEALGLRLPVVHDATRNARLRDVGYAWFGYASWLGVTDAATEGVWTWVDGSAADFTQWHYGQPDDYAGEDCAAINFGDWGYWNDYPCSYALPFMCEGGA